MVFHGGYCDLTLTSDDGEVFALGLALFGDAVDCDVVYSSNEGYFIFKTTVFFGGDEGVAGVGHDNDDITRDGAAGDELG